MLKSQGRPLEVASAYSRWWWRYGGDMVAISEIEWASDFSFVQLFSYGTVFCLLWTQVEGYMSTIFSIVGALTACTRASSSVLAQLCLQLCLG